MTPIIFLMLLLSATAVAALSWMWAGRIVCNRRKSWNQFLNLCIGDAVQRIFKARRPPVTIKIQQYPKLMDEMQNLFKRERNVTHERGLFCGRKQKENATFEKFHSELSALAGRCNFATQLKTFAIFLSWTCESLIVTEIYRSPQNHRKMSIESRYRLKEEIARINFTQRHPWLLNKNGR